MKNTTAPHVLTYNSDLTITVSLGNHTHTWASDANGEPMNLAVFALAQQLDYLTDQMVDRAKRIADTTQRALDALLGGYNLNSLGHYQTEAQQFDLMCAQRATLVESLTSVLYAAIKATEVSA